jgi:hypothetical protein
MVSRACRYPSDADKQLLARQTGLSRNQVCTLACELMHSSCSYGIVRAFNLPLLHAYTVELNVAAVFICFVPFVLADLDARSSFWRPLSHSNPAWMCADPHIWHA